MKRIILAVLIIFVLSGYLYAQEGQAQKGPPPAVVVVSEITRGVAEPMAEFVGTVYYTRVSDVASEVAGKVEEVSFEEGQRVKAGDILVRLNTDLLQKAIKSTQASYEQVLFELEKAQKDFKRVESLFKEDSIAETVYDEHFFRVKGLEKKAASLKAELDRLLLEKEKKTIRAPFSGIVIKKSVEKGEWVSPGGAVASIADDSEVDVLVNVPEGVLGYLKLNRMIEINSGGKQLKGRYITFIPKGDVATRTFSIKLRLKNTAHLVEGMEAVVILPVGEKSEGLVVPRDAVITVFGQSVVFVVEESKAKMIPVKVRGYTSMMAGIEAPGLQEGMKVVIKGNERLRDGQPVVVRN